jgi:hypothetical protein
MYLLSLNIEQNCYTVTHSVAVYVIESVALPNVLCYTILSVAGGTQMCLPAYITGNDDFQKLDLNSLCLVSSS